MRITTALRNKKMSNSHKKNITLLPQCIACYLTAYYVEGNPYFEVFYVHEKSPFLMYLLGPPVVSYCHRAPCGIKLIRKTTIFEN